MHKYAQNSTITVSTRKVQNVECTCKVLTIVYPLIDRSVMLYLVPGTSISPKIGITFTDAYPKKGNITLLLTSCSFSPKSNGFG